MDHTNNMAAGANKMEQCSHAARKSRTAKAFALALVAMSLAGCEHDKEPIMIAADYEARHLIEVVKKSEAIKLHVSPGAYGLSRRQEEKVRNFLAAYKANPQGGLMIAAPTGGDNEGAVLNILTHIHHLSREYAITKSALHVRPYLAEGQSRPPIRMFFEQNIAIPPNCPDWSENLARDRDNIPYPNFGCAMQRNLAVMVANPRDFLEPRGTAPRSRPSDRRDVVHDKYVKGEPTGAQKAENESGAVSEVGQ